MAVRVQVPPSAPNIIRAPDIGALLCLEPANGTRDLSLDRSRPSVAFAIRQRRVGVRTKHNQSPGYRGFVVSGASEQHAGLVPGSLSAIRGLFHTLKRCFEGGKVGEMP